MTMEENVLFVYEKASCEGVFLVSDGEKLRYRIWFNKQWYPMTYAKANDADHEYRYIRKLRSDRRVGALILTLTLAVITACVWLVLTKYL